MVKVGDKDKLVTHLLQKKEVGTAYLLWANAGLVGAHHFYLDRVVHGVLSLGSLNFLFCGWVLDALLIPVYVRSFNSRTAGVARHDASCRHICSRLPVVFILWSVVFYLVVAKTPRFMHELGLVDLDRAIAKTKENPYTLLGVQPDTEMNHVYAAYRDKQKHESKMLMCDRKCKENLAEYKKAYNYISGGWKEQVEDSKAKRKKRRRKDTEESEDEAHNQAWSDWSEFVSLEWKVILEKAQDGLKEGVW